MKRGFENQVEAAASSHSHPSPMMDFFTSPDPVVTVRVPVGATCRSDGSTLFRVWSPHRSLVELHIVGPEERRKLYEDLFRIRRETPALRHLDLDAVEAYADDERRVVVMRRWWDTQQVLVAFNFSERSEKSLAALSRGVEATDRIERRVEESAIALAPYSFGLWQA